MTTQTQLPEEYRNQCSDVVSGFYARLEFLRNAGVDPFEDFLSYKNAYRELDVRTRAVGVKYNIELSQDELKEWRLDVKYKIIEYFDKYNELSPEDTVAINALNDEYKIDEYYFALIVLNWILGITEQLLKGFSSQAERTAYLEREVQYGVSRINRKLRYLH